MNIGAIQHVIAALEPIARKLSTMAPAEKAAYTLPRGLGSPSEAIYRRVIQRVYDKERGKEVIEALHKNPATAVPVVLHRLKKKDEEWRRGKREWNKVWREIDAKNFYKALDHQGVNFKANDKRAINTKTLVSEIGERHRARLCRVLSAELPGKQPIIAHDPPAGLAHGLPDHPDSKNDLEFKMKDTAVFRHVTRLLNSYMERSMKTLPSSLLDSVVLLYRDFMREFFLVDVIDPESLRLPRKFRDVEPAGSGVKENAENVPMDIDASCSSWRDSGGGSRRAANENGCSTSPDNSPVAGVMMDDARPSASPPDPSGSARRLDDAGTVKMEPAEDDVPTLDMGPSGAGARTGPKSGVQPEGAQQQREQSPAFAFPRNERPVKASPFVELEEEESGGRSSGWKAETWITWVSTPPSFPPNQQRADGEPAEAAGAHGDGSPTPSATRVPQTPAGDASFGSRQSSVLNCNANLYCFFRLYEVRLRNDAAACGTNVYASTAELGAADTNMRCAPVALLTCGTNSMRL
ncbi:MAG: hypothetical protein BJ554DRAFT_5168 [Olpidium bornovanus]|uniref:Histone deacetylase interacting domain-containing protein n=1 Tax=Olpidium bornovanus TaxID=278681 RepID=A0A8H8DEC2_9FUNG|nr:MAG: hypothetical protein BJ554DRAFT_5168 [Olpidium bornovanus]